MGVKRIDFVQDHERRDAWMEEAAHGQYVLAADYDALAAELETLRDAYSDMQHMTGHATCQANASKLEADLADWQRMRNEMRDAAFANKERADKAETRVREREMVLRAIATMEDEENEWDTVDKFRACRRFARNALTQSETK